MSSKPLFLSGWEVIGIRSAEQFFSALPETLALPVILCLEGTCISQDMQTLFAANAVTAGLQIPSGTIWPTPTIFHVRATREFVQQLAMLAEKHAGSEVCDHFHAYNENRGLMQWYDAFSGDPLLVDESIVEEKIRSLCQKLGAKYTSWSAKRM